MSAAQVETLSLEEFLARPERLDGQREELIEGELIVSPGPKIPHADIVRKLRRLLFSLEDRGYIVENDFSCILGDHTMPEPDLAAVKRERWLEGKRAETWLKGAPELAIEVMSPTNRRGAVMRKAVAYIEHGAEQVWLIYPKTRTVLVMTGDEAHELKEGDSLEFEGVRVGVADIFRSE